MRGRCVGAGRWGQRPGAREAPAGTDPLRRPKRTSTPQGSPHPPQQRPAPRVGLSNKRPAARQRDPVRSFSLSPPLHAWVTVTRRMTLVAINRTVSSKRETSFRQIVGAETRSQGTERVRTGFLRDKHTDTYPGIHSGDEMRRKRREDDGSFRPRGVCSHSGDASPSSGSRFSCHQLRKTGLPSVPLTRVGSGTSVLPCSPCPQGLQ